jgi:hypothetical protein
VDVTWDNRLAKDDTVHLPVGTLSSITLTACHVPSGWAGHTHADLNGSGVTEGRLRLDRLPATASRNFLPLRTGSHSSRAKKAALGRPPLCFGHKGAVSIAVGLYTAIEAAMGAARANRKR